LLLSRYLKALKIIAIVQVLLLSELQDYSCEVIVHVVEVCCCMLS
jgi:hypothetical protein